jgi:2-methylisocitrate lyase-like PEP mutase family enzyme
MSIPAQRLRTLLAGPDFLTMPCCFDPLSAKLIEQAGFPLTFMSGFAVSAARLALPDTGLISYAEMLDQGRNICAAVDIPVIGDGDTGYGNPANVRRTVQGYAAAGFAGIMIEDQLAPKRCGHTGVKEVVSRSEALQRLRAACDARDEGADILVMARTDARAALGLEEALWRIRAFADAGADILFLEAPRNEEEMQAFCDAAPGPKLANMLEEGITPILPPARLAALGYKIAAYPLTLLNSAVFAMREALVQLQRGETPKRRVSFQEIRDLVGFAGYDRLLERYADGAVETTDNTQ